jgi:hypothetical protein
MVVSVLKDIIDFGVGFFGVFVFVLLALAGEIGFRIGQRRARSESWPDKENAGVSTLTTGMIGLMAFTLALTIGFAQDRFEARRHATLYEANAIGTAWLRTGIAGPPGKPIAALIEEYARSRLAYLVAKNTDAPAAELERANALQAEIWQGTLQLLEGMPAPLAASLVSSVSDMISASLPQRYAMESRAPVETMLMLLGGAMLATGALGFQVGLSGRRQLVLAMLLLVMVSGAMVMIVDLNRPRVGLTQIDPAPLEWTIQGFAPTSPR